MKRKYLNIENTDQGFYIYLSDRKWGNKELTLDQLDEECRVSEGKYYINLSKMTKQEKAKRKAG
jgi:DNA-directed RNA polymerase delta subunit